MDTEARVTDRTNTLYNETDLDAIRQQISKRWTILAIPVAVFLAAMIAGFLLRVEWLAPAGTIAAGALLIFGYDLFIKPLDCYRRHLRNVLYGRVREVELPFVALSPDIDLVDGVNCRAMTCADVDGKGRPYDRLFYLDAAKTLPDFKAGEMLRIVHHDLMVADVTRA